MGDELIYCRIPDRVIDTIDDAEKVFVSRSYDTLKTVSELGRALNLLRVTFAHCREGVSEHESGLHHVQVPVGENATLG